MKNTKPSLLLGFLLLTFVSASLLGCGGGDKPSSPPAAKPAPAVAPAKPAASQNESLETIMMKAKQAPGFFYDMVIKGPGMNSASKIWSNKDRMRIENTFEGKKMITIIDGDTTYMYNPESNTAMKFTGKDMPGDMGEKPENPANYQDQMAKDSLKSIGTETIDGVKCRVLTYVDKEDGATAKMWLREDYGLPMRQEIMAKSGEKMTMEYKNMKIGAQSPDLFKLPAGTKIQDVSAMMQGKPPSGKQ